MNTLEYVLSVLKSEKLDSLSNFAGESGESGESNPIHCFQFPSASNGSGETGERQRVVQWINRTASTTTLEEMFFVLTDFSRHPWTLLERAELSSTYTPHAIRLIRSEGKDLHRTLEDLAVLCWNKSNSSER
jgi:hypothetical protein